MAETKVVGNRLEAPLVLSAALLGADGTVLLPGYAFSGDTNTGFCRIGTDTLNLVTGGQTGLSISSTQAVSIRGTVTNDSAIAGYVGEYVSSANSSGSSFPTSSQFGDLLSISLTAGDWDVTGIVEAEQNGSTITSWLIGIGLVSGNNQTGLNNGDNRVEGFVPTASSRSTMTCPNYRLSINATTTVYLKYYANYSGAVPIAYGRLSARRVR